MISTWYVSSRHTDQFRVLACSICRICQKLAPCLLAAFDLEIGVARRHPLSLAEPWVDTLSRCGRKLGLYTANDWVSLKQLCSMTQNVTVFRTSGFVTFVVQLQQIRYIYSIAKVREAEACCD